MHLESSSFSLLPCLLDRKGCGVDPPHFMPFICKEEGMLTCPASYIQDRSCYLSPPDQFNKLLLGPADVPGGCAFVSRVKEILTSPWILFCLS
jgi:hypothetical protein